MKRNQTYGPNRTRRAWRRALMAATVSPALLALLPVAAAQVQQFAFDIESQPLSSALLSFGRQADLSVLAPTTLVEGKVAPAVRGQLSSTAALERLLEGSGLTYTFVQSNAVRIVAKDQAAASPPNSPADDRDAQDRVVVTGTNIRGIAPVTSPVTVYTYDDIIRTGATTTEQFVEKMPQNLGTLSQYAVGSTTNAGSNLDGVTAIDLRGLGVGTTLTLLNGHRMALSNAGASADVSFIPTSAIDRVEVLTDGASAIYGSDAIGGVVNFVLRDDFEGAEARLSYGGVTRGGLRQGDASLTAGTTWSDGHGLISYSFHGASALKSTDRDYSAGAGQGNLTPVDTRHSLFATASQNFGDRLSVGLDMGGSWRKVKSGYSNLTSPVPANQTFLRYRSQSDQFFGTVDVDYELTGDLAANFTASYSEIDTDGVASLVRFNRIPQLTTNTNRSSRNSQLDLSGKLDGALFELPGGDVRFSVGGGVLEEAYKGINLTSSTQTAGELGRQSTYAFGELFIPLVGSQQEIPFVHKLTFSLAARYTDYKDTSEPSLSRDFGDSTDPKVGFLWAPSDSLSFRGTYGSSFRAPNLTQLDPVAGAHYLLIVPVAGVNSILLGMAGYAIPELGPETAETYTLGLDFNAPDMPDLRVSANYYNIDYTDRIGTAPSGAIDPFATPNLLPDLIYRPPSAAFIEETLRATPLLSNTSPVNVSDPQAGAAALFARNDVWIYDNRFRNLAVSRQDGIDLSVTQRLDTGFGDLRVGANVTHILNFEQQGSPTTSVLNVVDVPGQPADWRGRLFANLSAGDFDGTIGVNYVDSYQNAQAPVGRQTIDSWVTLDAALAYDLKDMLPGLRLNLSVQNLLDEDPPLLRTGPGSNIRYPVGFDPANANPLGRFIVLGITQKW